MKFTGSAHVTVFVQLEIEADSLDEAKKLIEKNVDHYADIESHTMEFEAWENELNESK